MNLKLKVRLFSRIHKKKYCMTHSKIVKILCIPITINNPLKVCFSNKKYLITTQTYPTQFGIRIFLIKKPGLSWCTKLIASY